MSQAEAISEEVKFRLDLNRKVTPGAVLDVFSSACHNHGKTHIRLEDVWLWKCNIAFEIV